MGVSWYEAVAYCRWLSEIVGYEVSLPSEAQWDRAARHTDGRTYPWGSEEVAATRCNMGETGIGHTSTVGLFPEGNAACGALDMAGNVWEWWRTKWRGDYENYERKAADVLGGEDARLLRGGAFYVDRDSVRCAARGRYVPHSRVRSVGFRVVTSPFSADR